MPLYLFKFRQLSQVEPDSIAHWGIYHPNNGHGSPVENGFPVTGDLFHARGHFDSTSQCFTKCNLPTQYAGPEYYDLRYNKRPFDWYPVAGTDHLTSTHLNAACHWVTQQRAFDIYKNNCQRWVQQVLDYLVQTKQLPNSILEDIKDHGYTTMKQRCGHCMQSSFPCLRCMWK